MNRFLFAFVIIAGFLFFINYSSTNISDDQLDAYSVNLQIADSFKHKYDMNMVGTGLGAPYGKVESMKLMFQLHKTLSKEESRILIMNCAEEYLKKINNDPSLQKHLCCHPFPVDKIDLSIFLFAQDENIIKDPDIGIVQLLNGIVKYIYIEDKPHGRFKKIDKESFAESLKIIKGV